MRFLLPSLICLQLILIGCRDVVQDKSSRTSKNTYTIEQTPATTYAEKLKDEAKNAETAKKKTRHLDNFLKLLPDTPEAAWVELEKFVKLQYGDHRFANEWIELVFTFTSEKKALILELIRCCEIEIQMLTDIDTEKHDAKIKRKQLHLKQLQNHVKQLEIREINPKTHKVGFELSIKREHD